MNKVIKYKKVNRFLTDSNDDGIGIDGIVTSVPSGTSYSFAAKGHLHVNPRSMSCCGQSILANIGQMF